MARMLSLLSAVHLAACLRRTTPSPLACLSAACLQAAPKNATPGGSDTGGWANSFLKDKADEGLGWLAWANSLMSPLQKCRGDHFTLHNAIPALALQELLVGRDAQGKAAPLGELPLNVTAHGLPCK